MKDVLIDYINENGKACISFVKQIDGAGLSAVIRQDNLIEVDDVGIAFIASGLFRTRTFIVPWGNIEGIELL